jgi:phosphoribosylformylglycinamidine synthase
MKFLRVRKFKMKARVTVMLKNGVLDPQGEAIKHALNSLEYNNVESVRQGKVIEIGLDETSEEKANKSIKEMCEKLLANTVIESYEIEII